MAIDSPKYDTNTTDKDSEKKQVINLSEQTSDDFLKNLR